MPITHNNKAENTTLKSMLEKETEEKLMDDIFNSLMKNSDYFLEQGRVIARDCYINGIKKSNKIQLSEIETFISNEYNSEHTLILNGFIKHMLELEENSKISIINTDNNETFFVSNDYLQKYNESKSTQAVEKLVDSKSQITSTIFITFGIIGLCFILFVLNLMNT